MHELHLGSKTERYFDMPQNQIDHHELPESMKGLESDPEQDVDADAANEGILGDSHEPDYLSANAERDDNSNTSLGEGEETIVDENLEATTKGDKYMEENRGIDSLFKEDTLHEDGTEGKGTSDSMNLHGTNQTEAMSYGSMSETNEDRSGINVLFEDELVNTLNETNGRGKIDNLKHDNTTLSNMTIGDVVAERGEKESGTESLVDEDSDPNKSKSDADGGGSDVYSEKKTESSAIVGEKSEVEKSSIKPLLNEDSEPEENYSKTNLDGEDSDVYSRKRIKSTMTMMTKDEDESSTNSKDEGIDSHNQTKTSTNEKNMEIMTTAKSKLTSSLGDVDTTVNMTITEDGVNEDEFGKTGLKFDTEEGRGGNETDSVLDKNSHNSEVMKNETKLNTVTEATKSVSKPEDDPSVSTSNTTQMLSNADYASNKPTSNSTATTSTISDASAEVDETAQELDTSNVTEGTSLHDSESVTTKGEKENSIKMSVPAANSTDSNESQGSASTEVVKLTKSTDDFESKNTDKTKQDEHEFESREFNVANTTLTSKSKSLTMAKGGSNEKEKANTTEENDHVQGGQKSNTTSPLDLKHGADDAATATDEDMKTILDEEREDDKISRHFPENRVSKRKMIRNRIRGREF